MKLHSTSAFTLAATALPLISIVKGSGDVCSDENNKEWHLKHMKVPEAWAYSDAHGQSSGGEGIVITQIDTGYSDHKLFEGMFPDGEGAVKGFNIRFYADRLGYVSADNPKLYDPKDPMRRKWSGIAIGHAHGTVVASAAMNRGTTEMEQDRDLRPLAGLAPRGAAPKANLHSIRAVDNPVLGPLDSARVREAFDVINNEGVDEELIGEDNVHVISISLGSFDEMYNNFQNLETKMHKAMDDKNVIIVSAGGQVVDFIMKDAVWPGRYDRVITVGGYQIADIGGTATENYWERSMTWWVSAIDGPSIDITGPALNVCNGNSKRTRMGLGEIAHFYSGGEGTSLATAFLGGIAALWLGHHGRDNLIELFDVKNGIKLQEAFRGVLKLTANQEGWDGEYDTTKHGYGMIDAEAIVKLDLQEVVEAIKGDRSNGWEL